MNRLMTLKLIILSSCSRSMLLSRSAKSDEFLIVDVDFPATEDRILASSFARW